MLLLSYQGGVQVNGKWWREGTRSNDLQRLKSRRGRPSGEEGVLEKRGKSGEGQSGAFEFTQLT